jgi:hypothetical protein
MTVRVLERLSTFTPLGLRFWDLDFARAVTDGMAGLAWPVGAPHGPVVAAVPTFSGALAFHGLPGLRRLEAEGPGGPHPSPLPRFVVEVADTKRRYAPAAFTVELPLPYSGPYVGPVMPSPPPPGFLLFSGPDRQRDAALAVVSGELALAATGAPAAWAVVTVTDPDGTAWHGIADAAGRFKVVLPWPTLDEVVPGSPPSGAASALARRTWPITVSVQAAASPLLALTAGGLPDYVQVLTQPVALIWPDRPDASPPPAPVAALAFSLSYGATLVLRSGGLSRLLVGDGPPSSP